MIEIKLSQGIGQKLRLWIGDFPQSLQLPSSDFSIQYIYDATGNASRHDVAIEIFRPRGGSFEYGLLAAKLDSKNSGNLTILMPKESFTNDHPYLTSIVGTLDTVVIGTMSEYNQGIASGISKFDKTKLPSGQLTIYSIAHGQVGSSFYVFELLGIALIRLLIENNYPKTADEAAALLLPVI